ncbi:amino acid permease [Streptomyces sp. NPDC102384]|uniref:amino acid permease n=1 Tax=Streptomyces sp. NPDC102384 TaxID=3366166 RepID=UPI0038217726
MLTEGRPGLDSSAGAPRGGLAQGLHGRHMTMISIGGAIGAGLFVGSGAGIRQAGPGILLAYALTSLIVVLIMRMLAELAVARPDTGAFAVYARLAFGRWAGFAGGWMYWVGWPLGLAIDAIASGTIVHGWLPSIPVWVAALVLVAVVTVVNLTSVRAYGEMEFWVVWLKVAVIVAFIGIGLVAVGGLLPGTDAPGTTNLFGHGGFLPHGMAGVLLAMTGAMFSFSGSEIVTIAAGEAKDPAKAIRGCTRSILWRVSVFYLGSLAVVVLLLPWNAGAVGESPFAATLTHLGLDNASAVLQIVLFAAMVSTMNSQVYASSRMLFALARDRDAPAALGRVSATSAPRNAILFTVSLAVACVLLEVVHPTTAFDRLVSMAGDTMFVTWLSVAGAQIVLGRRDRRAGQAPEPGTGMWLFPWLSWAVLLVVGAMFVSLIVMPDSRVDALGALMLTLILSGVSFLCPKPTASPT